MKSQTTVLVMLAAAAFTVALLARLFLAPVREGFAQQEVGMPTDGGGAGLYDGLDLTSPGTMWASTPKPTPLKPYENANDNEIFQYQNSKFTPECCPSSITSDTGCLCPTKQEERDWLTRGGNRIPN
jgi:hypothetical protein